MKLSIIKSYDSKVSYDSIKSKDCLKFSFDGVLKSYQKTVEKCQISKISFRALDDLDSMEFVGHSIHFNINVEYRFLTGSRYALARKVAEAKFA